MGIAVQMYKGTDESDPWYRASEDDIRKVETAFKKIRNPNFNLAIQQFKNTYLGEFERDVRNVFFTRMSNKAPRNATFKEYGPVIHNLLQSKKLAEITGYDVRAALSPEPSPAKSPPAGASKSSAAKPPPAGASKSSGAKPPPAGKSESSAAKSPPTRKSKSSTMKSPTGNGSPQVQKNLEVTRELTDAQLDDVYGEDDFIGLFDLEKDVVRGGERETNLRTVYKKYTQEGSKAGSNGMTATVPESLKIYRDIINDPEIEELDYFDEFKSKIEEFKAEKVASSSSAREATSSKTSTGRGETPKTPFAKKVPRTPFGGEGVTATRDATLKVGGDRDSRIVQRTVELQAAAQAAAAERERTTKAAAEEAQAAEAEAEAARRKLAEEAQAAAEAEAARRREAEEAQAAAEAAEAERRRVADEKALQDAFTQKIMKMVERNVSFDEIEKEMKQNQDLKPPYKAVFDLGVKQKVGWATSQLLKDPNFQPYGTVRVFVDRLADEYANDEIDVRNKYLEEKGMVEELGILQFNFNRLNRMAQEAMSKIEREEHVDEDVEEIREIVGNPVPRGDPWNEINKLLEKHERMLAAAKAADEVLQDSKTLQLKIEGLEATIDAGLGEFTALSARAQTVLGKFGKMYGSSKTAPQRMVTFRDFLTDVEFLVDQRPDIGLKRIDDKFKARMIVGLTLAKGDGDGVMETFIQGIADHLSVSPHALLDFTKSLPGRRIDD